MNNKADRSRKIELAGTPTSIKETYTDKFWKFDHFKTCRVY